MPGGQGDVLGTVWHLADKASQWFSPSDSAFMIDYRVDDLEDMLVQRVAAGLPVIGGPEPHENGKFAWVLDPDVNKVELRLPILWEDKNKDA
jgi:predicted enzyme related to lactoylglutathione lyase